VAHIVVSKFADALPLYRQAQMLSRQGVTLNRSTLANWVGRACWWLQREVGGQAAMAAGGRPSSAAWKRCPKPVPSVPL
jgi:transposase